jgi:hypothetical protein
MQKKVGEKFYTVCVQDVLPSMSPAEQHAMNNVFIRYDACLQAEGNHSQDLLIYSEQKI